MRMLAKNLFKEREKALTTSIKEKNTAGVTNLPSEDKIVFFVLLVIGSVLWEMTTISDRTHPVQCYDVELQLIQNTKILTVEDEN